MAKIGVITFSQTLDNYGQVLQYLAIQEYLKSRGHEVSLIRFSYSTNILKRIYRKTKKMVKHIIKKEKKKEPTTFDKWSEITEKYELLHPRNFEKFRNRFCNITYLNQPSYKRNFDAFVVGSDQIWSSLSPLSYLSFTKYGEVKFSLAPSIGKMKVDDQVIQQVKTWLKDFKFITCREQSGVDMCRRAGRNDAKCILDPTFLLSKNEYLKYSVSEANVEKYIFVYMLGADITVELAEIYDFAQKEGLVVKYVASQGREDEYPKDWATIPEWIFLLANAKYVFTNSFHGMALSCIFQKQFLVFPIIGEMKGMNERIFTIAGEFNCVERIYNNDLNKVKLPIDYKQIQAKIDENRNVVNKLLDSIYY